MEQSPDEGLPGFEQAWGLVVSSGSEHGAGDDARRVLSELSIAAAGVGTFDWDLRTGTLTWDERLIEQFGYDPATFDQTIEAFNARVHPDDLPRVSTALQASVATCSRFDADYRIVLPDGRTRWISAKGRAIADEGGTARRLVGATLDVSATRTGEAAVTSVLEAMNAAFYSLDRDWRFTYVNAEAERLLQRPRTDLLGGSIWELFPAAVGSEFESHYRAAVQEGRMVTFDAHYPAPLDGWYELRALPTADGLSVYFLDITARRRAQRAAEDAARRSALVGAVTSELAEHLDTETAVGHLARLVVPVLADWCVVTLVADDDHGLPVEGAAGVDLHHGRRRLRDIGWWHADPAARPLVREYVRVRLRDALPGSFLAEALQARSPVVVPAPAAAAIRRTTREGPCGDLVDALAPEHVVALPLRARGRTVGLLSLYRGADRGAPGTEDLATSSEVAGRAALALDNARLYQQQRTLAEALQRSLFTAPPDTGHVEVAVRYAPAAEVAQVGGDWYDAFLQRGGSTVVVIGDVVGHDSEAAAAMSQIRTLVRGLGAADDDGPATVLRRVDEVMQTLRIATTATAVVARLEQGEEDRGRGTARLTWSNAGHPPPVVVDPDGTVRMLTAEHADLLLGVLAGTTRRQSEVALDRGATVLLYTDGLVERRDQGLDAGLHRLAAVLAELPVPRLPLDELCDRLLARMLPGRAEDDVALVAVRLHPTPPV